MSKEYAINCYYLNKKNKKERERECRNVAFQMVTQYMSHTCHLGDG